jgi:hypothetical protein
MKTAKEMFEELGYELFEEKDSRYITYVYHDRYIIQFDLIMQNFYAYEDNMDMQYIGVDMKMLQAINKQCEEMGWLDA